MVAQDAKESEPPSRLLLNAKSHAEDIGSVPPSGPALPSLLKLGAQLYLMHIQPADVTACTLCYGTLHGLNGDPSSSPWRDKLWGDWLT